MNENPCSNREIHLLFENGFKLENTENEREVICMKLHKESVADQTDNFASAFIRKNVAYGYEYVTRL